MENKCCCPFCEHKRREEKRKALEALIQKAVASTITDYVPLLVPNPCMELKHRTLQDMVQSSISDQIMKDEIKHHKERDAKETEIDDTWIVYKKAYNVKINQLREELKERTEKLKARTEKQTEKPPQELNFCRVFELPDSYPEGFCFGGGKPVLMLMVDWFNPWPDNPELKTWEDVVKLLRPFLQKKTYVKPGKRYILITDFGASLVFTKED